MRIMLDAVCIPSGRREVFPRREEDLSLGTDDQRLGRAAALVYADETRFCHQGLLIIMVNIYERREGRYS
jgi:hypothetical protein